MRLLILLLLISILSACAPAPEAPISNDDPIPPQKVDYLPAPGDSNLLREPAFVDSAEILTLESYPLQFTLTRKGSLPTQCHELRVAVSPADAQNKINVDVYSVVDLNTTCLALLESFELNFPLGSFPAGRYSVWENGELVAEIQS